MQMSNLSKINYWFNKKREFAKVITIINICLLEESLFPI